MLAASRPTLSKFQSHNIRWSKFLNYIHNIGQSTDFLVHKLHKISPGFEAVKLWKGRSGNSSKIQARSSAFQSDLPTLAWTYYSCLQQIPARFFTVLGRCMFQWKKNNNSGIQLILRINLFLPPFALWSKFFSTLPNVLQVWHPKNLTVEKFRNNDWRILKSWYFEMVGQVKSSSLDWWHCILTRKIRQIVRYLIWEGQFRHIRVN